MGFDVLDSESEGNWLLDKFKKLISQPEKKILDVGCGYGRISQIALAQGQTVIANDIAEQHLIYLSKKAREQQLNLEKLYLNNKAFPSDMTMETGSLDAIVFYRVLHFLSGQTIENGLAKSYGWLKEGGKVFIVVMSPQHTKFSEWFLPIYESRWARCDLWPGENLPVAQALPGQAYNLPRHLHVMDGRPLECALKEQGFVVEEAGFIDMSRFGSNEKPSNSGKPTTGGAFGLIARKPVRNGH